MEITDLSPWRSNFQTFICPFQKLFCRAETRQLFEHHLRALISANLPTKNAWTIAEEQGLSCPQPFQRLVRRCTFDDVCAMELYTDTAIKHFATDDAILLFDETGFIKSGKHSVGVQRQYTGTSGKIDNCQIAVFAAIKSSRGHCLLDRKLYLPVSWTSDPLRCARAGVPEHIEFVTKPALAMELYQRCRQRGLCPAWVSADCVYGDNPDFRHGLYQLRQPFVLAVSSNTPVFIKASMPHQKPETICDVVKRWQRRFKTISMAQGSRGSRKYRWGMRRVYLSTQGTPRMSVLLLVRRSLSDPSDMAYYICWNPKPKNLKELAHVASKRWAIEECFKEAKSWTGLDQYQTRKWNAWHRSTLFSMLAHLWLAVMRAAHRNDDTEKLDLSVAEVVRLWRLSWPPPNFEPLKAWMWSLFRRRHNHKAKLSHTRRRESYYATLEEAK